MYGKILVAMVIFCFTAFGSINAAEYVVKNDDTLSAIALRTGHSFDRLVVMNSFEKPNFIREGSAVRYIWMQTSGMSFLGQTAEWAS